MQLITNGPDIPEELLQAQEEGRVIFFCGAGISYPAGLPGFKGLVDEIYQLAGTYPNDLEQAAYEKSQFDATLDLLERRLPGKRQELRGHLAKILNPRLRRKNATATHEALLQLSKSRAGKVKLVTTNFDNLFCIAAKRSEKPFNPYCAPTLPIPKNSKWDGVVFLHGLLDGDASETDLNRLVLTSGDFGLAYLIERWASRFVSELFRNYIVCFVGYSIDDPVLRYMMDALAADRMQGEDTPQAYAFGACENGEEKQKETEWKAKGVSPILYKLTNQIRNPHHRLHDTLQTWANLYRDGTSGKEAIINSYAMTRPQESTSEDNFVSRMIWALSDKSGLPAKRFAKFNPAPSLDWLFGPLSEPCFTSRDLPRFGITAELSPKFEPKFSLISRPASYSLTPLMQLVSYGPANTRWDDVMNNLADWLIRHLNDPNLLIWFAEHGGGVHPTFASKVFFALDKFSNLSKKSVSEISQLRSNSPMAIPSSKMIKLWRLLLNGQTRSAINNQDIYTWLKTLKEEGLNIALRFQLRDLLSPKVVFSKPYSFESKSNDKTSTLRISELVHTEIVLNANFVNSVTREIETTIRASDLTTITPLVSEFQRLLLDALDLMLELELASESNDLSILHLPSIHEHSQNRDLYDWTALITLLRGAWLALRDKAPSQATAVALNWFDIPYLAFKRLALFAASHDDCINSEIWTNWLFSNKGKLLWSHSALREVMRLLVLQGRNLSSKSLKLLEGKIILGPPSDLYKTKLDPDDWKRTVEREVWLRLAKLEQSGIKLSSRASSHLVKISLKHPEWSLSESQREEFSHWMSGTGYPDYDDQANRDIAPENHPDLVKWLSLPVTNRSEFYGDTWSDVCKTRFDDSISALLELAQKDDWPLSRWRTALQTWSQDKDIIQKWPSVFPLLVKMPQQVLIELIDDVTRFVQSESDHLPSLDNGLVSFSRRILELPINQRSGITENGELIDDAVMLAINHPVGHITTALINSWFKLKPNDDELLPSELKTIFAQICSDNNQRLRHGRVILASRLVTLFRVDRKWTKKHLLTLFNWRDPVEASAAWQGFLWSPRIFPPLMNSFKSDFFDAVRHYSKLGAHKQQLVTLLTFSALGSLEGYDETDFIEAFSALPQEGLEYAAQALVQALEGAGEQREEYFNNRFLPLWQKFWPKSHELISTELSRSLGHVAIAARGEFPKAFKTVKDWLQPLDDSFYTIHLLAESGLCKRFPDDALAFIGKVTSNRQTWGPRKLTQCLDEIAEAKRSLRNSQVFIQLANLTQ